MPRSRAIQSLSAIGELTVLASVKKQRVLGGCIAEFFNAADENGMVAAGMGGVVGDLEDSATVWKYRRTAGARLPG